MIRSATAADASRLAEILVFTKRMSYRDIFKNDYVSFCYMQVLPLALSFERDEEELRGVYVYEDDGIVKGMSCLRAERDCGTDALELVKLYVDTFFQGRGIGDSLLSHALQAARDVNASHVFLWALKKNTKARLFYERHGFIATGDEMLEEGTPEYLVKYTLSLK